jgi:hypothetical protein
MRDASAGLVALPRDFAAAVKAVRLALLSLVLSAFAIADLNFPTRLAESAFDLSS